MKHNVMQVILGILAGISAVVILLISAFEVAMYSDFSFYEKEYLQYDVMADLDMELSDVMHVTRDMMAYLRGDKEELRVDTIVDGAERDFFNEQDRLHMYDVQVLFLGGLRLRTLACITAVFCVFSLIVTGASLKRLLPLCFEVVLLLFLAVTGLLAFLFSSDFNKYFTIFHEIFFSNDLWIFDASTDLMIRMLPEPFFFDMAFRIGAFFIGALGAVLALCAGIQAATRRQKKG